MAGAAVSTIVAEAVAASGALLFLLFPVTLLFLFVLITEAVKGVVDMLAPMFAPALKPLLMPAVHVL